MGGTFSLFLYTGPSALCSESEFPTSYEKPHQRGNGGPWRNRKMGGTLSFASFLVFFINAENLANTSFLAELDSGCWVPSLGYLEKFKARVSQISNV